MKLDLFFILITIGLGACKNAPYSSNTAASEELTKTPIDYPSELSKVFDRHGGLDLWKQQRTLSYNMQKGEVSESQIIDLWDRREYIEGENFISGHDGTNTWLKADTTYKGNAYFYHNLMFYFYAMPFVLADEGIIYSEVTPLKFEGKQYPGIGIGYNEHVGISPEDEYFMYYDPDTYEMVWLGYTVTYFSGEKSKRVSHIRYNDWKSFNGVKLPNSLSWYKTEDGKVTELRNTRTFTDVKLSTEEVPDDTYTMPKGGKVVSE